MLVSERSGGQRRLRCAARLDLPLGLVRRRRTEAEALDFFPEVVRREVAVDLRRQARILVTHDSLHGREVGAAHEQKGSGRVAEMVEANLPHLANGEELEVALRTATKISVGRGLAVPTALTPTFVNVAGDDAGPAHRAA